jgi:AcrR family transcriptional regulator
MIAVSFGWCYFLNVFKKEVVMSKGKKSKEEIFQKAIALFSAEGIENVTMRDLAAHCGMSPGAFYYYFKNKEDLILHFYQASLEGHLKRGEEFLESSPKDLSVVMNWICHDRFKELKAYRSMLRPLVFKFDSSSALSPWAKESYEIRRSSVEFFSEVTKYCLNVSNNQIIDIISRALWLHHLVIVGLWTVSEEGNNKGEVLLKESLKLWKWLPKFLKVPGSKSILIKCSNVLKKIGLWEKYEY